MKRQTGGLGLGGSNVHAGLLEVEFKSRLGRRSFFAYRPIFRFLLSKLCTEWYFWLGSV